MALPKFIARILGRNVEVSAIDQSAGVADASKVIATFTDGKIHPSLLPDGSSQTVLPASEALLAGSLVNIINVGGVAKVQLADSTAPGKECHGFVKAAVDADDPATVYFEGVVAATARTPGATQWLSAAGALTETPPEGDGVISQQVGVAYSATAVEFQRGETYKLAA